MKVVLKNTGERIFDVWAVVFFFVGIYRNILTPKILRTSGKHYIQSVIPIYCDGKSVINGPFTGQLKELKSFLLKLRIGWSIIVVLWIKKKYYSVL